MSHWNVHCRFVNAIIRLTKTPGRNCLGSVSLRWGHFRPDPGDIWVWSERVLQCRRLCGTYTTFCSCRSPRAASVAWWPLLPGPQHQPSAQQFPSDAPGGTMLIWISFSSFGSSLAPWSPFAHFTSEKTRRRRESAEWYFLFEYFRHTDASDIQFREMMP